MGWCRQQGKRITIAVSVVVVDDFFTPRAASSAVLEEHQLNEDKELGDITRKLFAQQSLGMSRAGIHLKLG